MFLYPKEYFNSVKDITIDFLKQNNIKALILDVDNTILDFDRKIPEGIDTWCEDLKSKGIKFCILSNTNKIDKVKICAEALNLPYFNLATKPFKRGFKKAVKLLNEKPENIAAVGDQIFTDVIGANRMKMYSILVKPIAKKDLLVTKIKRPLEIMVINSYLKSKQNKTNEQKEK